MGGIFATSSFQTVTISAPPVRRWRLAHFRWPLLLACVLLYFLYHAFNGQRGLPARLPAMQERAQLQQRLADLREKRAILQEKIRNLGGGVAHGTIDSDLLSELLRRPGIIRTDEVLLFEQR